MPSRWRFPACFAAGVLAFMLVCDLALNRVHERHGGELTGWLLGLSRLFELPGLMIAETFGARFRSRTGWAAWAVMLACSVPIYLAAGCVLRWVWAARPVGWSSGVPLNPHVAHTQDPVAERLDAEHPAAEHSAFGHADARPASAPSETRDTPTAADDVTLTRRGLFLLGRRAAVVGVAGTAAHAFFGELRDVEVTRQVVRIGDLPPSLHGLRVVHLTDIHHGPWTSLQYVRGVVDRANALRPDLVVLTGDYVHQSDVYIAPVVRELGRLRARAGVVATLGNHDWWEDGHRTLAEFAKTGVRTIDNHRLFLTAERTLERSVGPSDRRHALCLAGAGDLWEGSPHYGDALGGVPDLMPRLLLSHNPDVAEESSLLAYAPRIDLMLSGHTHGGQVCLPWLGTPIIPSRYGQKYAAGMVQSPLCPVYVNRGVGTTVMPLRLGVRPEIAVLELRAV